jgi:YD repeat-containing protein
MANLAHSLFDDELIRPQARRGRLTLFACVANDNAPPGDLALTAWEQTSLTAYTPTGKVARTTDPLGEATVTTYDPVDRPVFVTDAAGHVSGKTYDLAGEERSETSGVGRPLFQTDAAFTYGADGETLSVTDANSNLTQLANGGPVRVGLALEMSRSDASRAVGAIRVWCRRVPRVT